MDRATFLNAIAKGFKKLMVLDPFWLSMLQSTPLKFYDGLYIPFPLPYEYMGIKQFAIVVSKEFTESNDDEVVVLFLVSSLIFGMSEIWEDMEELSRLGFTYWDAYVTFLLNKLRDIHSDFLNLEKRINITAYKTVTVQFKIPNSIPVKVIQDVDFQNLIDTSAISSISVKNAIQAIKESPDLQRFIKNTTDILFNGIDLNKLKQEFRVDPTDTVNSNSMQIERGTLQKTAREYWRGLEPGIQAQVIKDFIKTSVKGLKEFQTAFHGKLISSSVRFEDQSPRARRFSSLPTPVPFDIGFTSENRVAICIDTSGSVGYEELQKMVGAIDDLRKKIHIGETLVILFHSNVYHKEFMIHPDPEKILKVFNEHSESGGTDFSPPMREAIKFNPDVIVFLTDGYADNPKEIYEVSTKVLWVLTAEGGEHLLGPKFYIEEGKING